MSFSVADIRKDFPILHQQVNGHPLVYLDNGATSQKPSVVIDAIRDYYLTINSNVHRGAHHLADLATIQFEETREVAQSFINAKQKEEVIFTKGTTEGINLVAFTFGRANVKKGDEVIISTMEHHSNIVPWQMLCEEVGATLKVIPINDLGELDMDAYAQMLNENTKLVSVMHVSNVLGTINPMKEIVRLAHQVGAKVLVDGAQSTPHFGVDVQDLDCDFLVFSSHKVFGPTGIGILYGKLDLLEAMPPFHGGGEMIKEVSFEKTTYNDPPYKFEAGTPNIADVIGFKKALQYFSGLDRAGVRAHEEELLTYATEKLQKIDGLKIIGQAKEKASVISFIIEGVHHYDLGMMLDTQGIAIRTGHHCAQPLMKRFGVEGTARASFTFYNTKEEVDVLVDAIEKVRVML